MIRVFAAISSPRLRYVLGFLSEYFGQECVLTETALGADIAYGAAEGARLIVRPAGLLEETGWRPLDPPPGRHRAGFPVLFPDNSAFGFDIFSGIFYLLSRYEEYGPQPQDAYGRYAHQASVAFRHGFLQVPLIHRWLDHLSRQLFGSGQVPPFRFLPTYDIDMAWSYRHKGFARNAGGLLRSLFRRDGKVKERLSVLFRGAADPFDCYDFLDKLHARISIAPRYFIHAGSRRNAYDKNIRPDHPAMAALIKRLARQATIGLHPSWASGDEPALIAEEKRALEAVTGTPVTSSRQHYIRFSLPHTFRHLLEAGITDDYSMGYATINGFRASVAVPFYWYDLEREEQTALRLHPFCFMDANSYYEEKKSAGEMESELFYYEEQLRSLGGELVSIWHNTLLGSSPEFAGWARFYAFFAETITDD